MAEGLQTTSFTMQQQQAASRQYELLLHGLSHEDNVRYIDRHVLMLEKWSRDFSEGFFIRDLRYVIQVFSVLRERLDSHPLLFQSALSSILKVCSMPLFEVKANERLRSVSVDVIKEYMFEVSKFWLHGDSLRNAGIIRCFRSMVNGGVDPTILKVDVQKWVSDGLRVQVTDRVYLQTLLRDSGVVDFVVDAFNASAELYRTDYVALWGSLPLRKMPASSASDKSAGGDADSDNEGAEAAQTAEMQMIEQGSLTGESLDSSTQGADKSGSALDASKQALSDVQELTKLLTSLIMELTEDSRSACAMCLRKVSDGAIGLLDIAARENLRDPAVSRNLDLVWTVVDAYLQQAQGPSQVNNVLLRELVSSEVMEYEFAVSCLLRILLELMHDGYRLADKECRNEIVVVLSMIASFPASFPSFMCSGALNALVTYSCVAEMGSGWRVWPFYTRPIAKLRNFASIYDIDLQLKRTLWMCVSDVMQSNDADAILCVSSSPLLDLLMHYVEHDSSDSLKPAAHVDADESATLPSRIRGGGAATGGSSLFTSSQAAFPKGEESGVAFPAASQSTMLEAPSIAQQASGGGGRADAGGGGGHSVPEDGHSTNPASVFLKSLPLVQLRELQVLAMTFIAENGPKCLGEFLRVGGPVRVLDVLFRYSRSPVPEHKSLVYHSLLLLNRCLMMSDVVKRLMELENGAQTFLYLFEHTDDEAAKALAARVVSLLCADRNETCQQQVRLRGGVALMVKVISDYAEHRKVQVGRKARLRVQGIETEGVEDLEADSNGGDISLVVIAVLDCISKATTRNRRCEAQLAKDEGIDSLLLLLEVSPTLLRTQVLRLLADLLENRHLLTFLHAWRSPKSMRSAVQLFAHCWLDEEARLHASREKGIMCDIWNPLGNHDWPEDDINQRDGESVSSGGSLASIPKSLAVTRLTDAVSSARVNNGAVPDTVRHSVLEVDIRGIVARILYLSGSLDSYVNAVSPDFRVSFYVQNDLRSRGGPGSPIGSPNTADQGEPMEAWEEHKGEGDRGSPGGFSARPTSSLGDPGLTPADKQVLAVAQQYHALRAGEWWRQVAEELRAEGVQPIEADLALLESNVSMSFDAAFNVQTEQMELKQAELGNKGDMEKTFVQTILTKKEQQLKSLYLKKHGSRRV